VSTREIRKGYLHLSFPGRSWAAVFSLLDDFFRQKGWTPDDGVRRISDQGWGRWRARRGEVRLLATVIGFEPLAITIGREDTDGGGRRSTRATLQDLLRHAAEAGGRPIFDWALPRYCDAEQRRWRVLAAREQVADILHQLTSRRCPRCGKRGAATDPECWWCEHRFTDDDDRQWEAERIRLSHRIAELGQQEGLWFGVPNLPTAPKRPSMPPVSSASTGIRARPLPEGLLGPGERWGWRYHPSTDPLLPPPPEGEPVPRLLSPAWGPYPAVGGRLHGEAAGTWRAWASSCRAALTAYQYERAGWQHRVAASRKAIVTDAANRLRSVRWSAIRPIRTSRADVFGGTGDGWCCLLTTLLPSLVGSGHKVVLLDLSRRAVADLLSRYVKDRNRQVSRMLLPEAGAGLDLFAGLVPAQASESLLEAVRAASAEHAAASPREVDADILGRICDITAARLTLPRICAALGVLTHDEQPGTSEAQLTPDESARLAEVFGQTFRDAYRSRLVQLRSSLRPYSGWGTSAGARKLVPRDDQLTIVELTEHNDSPARLLGTLLVQVLVHQADQGEGGMSDLVVVVAGADLLPVAQLELLDRVTARAGVRLIYLFGHLREDAAQMIGRGGPVVLMRLGNHAEADTACQFIGREHRFVVHQFTANAGTGTSSSVTESESESHGVSWGPSGATRSETDGASRATTTGTSTSSGTSTARQRVYELVIEPRQLQTLPETAFILVDPDDHDGPRARLGDCNPWLVTAPDRRDVPWRELVGKRGRDPRT
jgi:hypothetical protein